MLLHKCSGGKHSALAAGGKGQGQLEETGGTSTAVSQLLVGSDTFSVRGLGVVLCSFIVFLGC